MVFGKDLVVVDGDGAVEGDVFVEVVDFELSDDEAEGVGGILVEKVVFEADVDFADVDGDEFEEEGKSGNYGVWLGFFVGFHFVDVLLAGGFHLFLGFLFELVEVEVSEFDSGLDFFEEFLGVGVAFSVLSGLVHVLVVGAEDDEDLFGLDADGRLFTFAL